MIIWDLLLQLQITLLLSKQNICIFQLNNQDISRFLLDFQFHTQAKTF